MVAPGLTVGLSTTPPGNGSARLFGKSVRGQVFWRAISGSEVQKRSDYNDHGCLEFRVKPPDQPKIGIRQIGYSANLSSLRGSATLDTAYNASWWETSRDSFGV